MTLPLIWLLKLAIIFSRVTRLGAGSTWPGHIMLGINPSFLEQFDKKFKGKITVIAGTNGKTTTSKIIRTILETNEQTVIHNETGANLLNGIASAIIGSTSWSGKLSSVAIFEADENVLPLLLKEVTADIVIVLNLFRDQLDRYGEVDAIGLKWKETLGLLSKRTTVLLNADDPDVAFLGKNLASKVLYFGVDDKKLYLAKRPHAMDVIYCPNCGERLTFEGIYLAHLGDWRCESCGLTRPPVDFFKNVNVLPGIYNTYNAQAAVLAAKALGVDEDTIAQGLKRFEPAFGRQEAFSINGKTVKIFLSKNPTGFNESLRTVRELGAKTLLFVLNDRIPDGRDVSWIWDVDFEEFLDHKMNIKVSGDRVFDMALRLKYTHPAVKHVDTHPLLDKALPKIIEKLPKKETLYILPTYSAMLEVRKILTGRKML